MAVAFDTLGYSKKLRDAGYSQKQAEAHAEAARDFIMAELVTKTDLAAAMDTLALRLTARLGGLMIAGIGALAVLIRLT
ncbi:CCDC90 family protein [Pararhizobium sp. BT-229]|uniref:CCDC90 family protein n=1 Tax=Pararhizobium sp. BT-229 TaxID=2986923 RepID=UPI0021F7C4F7|nr:CCDC90 family protein [Pararhizobium sp. BT-229]MCV9960751.1 CCDC90 family protein [Pararhizobium sp. BT-229]